MLVTAPESTPQGEDLCKQICSNSYPWACILHECACLHPCSWQHLKANPKVKITPEFTLTPTWPKINMKFGECICVFILFKLAHQILPFRTSSKCLQPCASSDGSAHHQFALMALCNAKHCCASMIRGPRSTWSLVSGSVCYCLSQCGVKTLSLHAPLALQECVCVWQPSASSEKAARH